MWATVFGSLENALNVQENVTHTLLWYSRHLMILVPSFSPDFHSLFIFFCSCIELNLSTRTTNRAPKLLPVIYLKLCVTVDFIFAFTHLFGIPVFRYSSILESNLL